jgi:hypothetical protein
MRHHVVPFFHEDVFTVDAAIVDVIIGVVEQGRRTGHLYFQIPEAFLIILLKGTARIAQEGVPHPSRRACASKVQQNLPVFVEHFF